MPKRAPKAPARPKSKKRVVTTARFSKLLDQLDAAIRVSQLLAGTGPARDADKAQIKVGQIKMKLHAWAVEAISVEK